MPFPARFPAQLAASTRNALLAALAIVLAAAWPACAAAQRVDTNPLNRDPQVQKAFADFYKLDYARALPQFDRVQAAHSTDPIATDYVLYVTLFQELFRLDLLDTTFYANDGFLTGKHTVVVDPKVRDRVKALAGKAIDQANTRLDKNPKDVDALFARGWAKSLEATYEAMVERSFVSALRQASSAKNDCEDVLDVDPNYVDAKLITGIYRYTVGALPFGFKLLFGVVGIHGSKSEGMAMLRDSAERGVITSVESRTVMALFLRRDAKYKKALAIDEALAAKYPHNFLFCLERANVSKDAGQGMKAVALYEELIRQAQRPGYFPSAHLELAYFGLGATLRGQHRYQESVDAFREGAFQPTTSPELKRRSLLAAGEVYDLMHQHDKAEQQYEAVIRAGRNTTQGDLAHKYLEDAYTGK